MSRHAYGTGKTTTMRMILGLDAPTQGSVTVGGAAHGYAKSSVSDKLSWDPTNVSLTGWPSQR